MRKIILSLTVLAGVAGLGAGAQAAVYSAPATTIPAHVQTVQYRGGYGGWHGQEYWHHRRHVEWRRHHEWGHWHHYHHGW